MVGPVAISFLLLAEMWQGLFKCLYYWIVNCSWVRMVNYDKLYSITWLLATRDWAKLDLLLETRAGDLISQTAFHIFEEMQ